jgi:hypothetical protein
MFYGNWFISVLGFLYWAYQITRSFVKYWNHENGGGFDIVMLHSMLFVANGLYLAYEVNVTFTPVYFTMLLLTDITGVWCYLLISQNDGDHRNMMKSESSKKVDFMIFCLIAAYTAAYFIPKHYGVRCTEESPGLASLTLCVFYMLWTCYTTYCIKHDTLIDSEHKTWRELYETTKKLCLHSYEGEYDHK